MMQRWLRPAAWVFVLVPLLAMAKLLPSGWDARTYETAVAEVRAGLSPYTVGLDRLRANHANGQAVRTMNYIYPPATLPVLRSIGAAPPTVRKWLYWLLYGAGLLAVLRVELACLTERERPFFTLLAPFTLFFPGLLYSDTALAGNIAPILYGLVGLGAAAGWRRGQRGWCYGAVLLAGTVKPPMLTLLALPVLLARGQWFRAAATGAAGCAIYAVQSVIWPTLSHDYGQLMRLEFLWNHEFGFSPAGQLGTFLLAHHLPYRAPCLVLYLSYVAAVFGVLHRCSQAYLAGRVAAADFLPVLLLGVLLLNPRTMQYDAAAVTLPMAVLLQRCCAAWAGSTRKALAVAGGLWLLGNLLVALTDNWNAVETVLLVALFVASAWLLLRQASPALVD